jgi:hypothetical protein
LPGPGHADVLRAADVHVRPVEDILGAGHVGAFEDLPVAYSVTIGHPGHGHNGPGRRLLSHEGEQLEHPGVAGLVFTDVLGLDGQKVGGQGRDVGRRRVDFDHVHLALAVGPVALEHLAGPAAQERVKLGVRRGHEDDMVGDEIGGGSVGEGDGAHLARVAGAVDRLDGGDPGDHGRVDDESQRPVAFEHLLVIAGRPVVVGRDAARSAGRARGLGPGRDREGAEKQGDQHSQQWEADPGLVLLRLVLFHLTLP